MRKGGARCNYLCSASLFPQLPALRCPLPWTTLLILKAEKSNEFTLQTTLNSFPPCPRATLKVGLTHPLVACPPLKWKGDSFHGNHQWKYFSLVWAEGSVLSPFPAAEIHREGESVCLCVFMHSYEYIFAVCVYEKTELCLHVWMSESIIFFESNTSSRVCVDCQHQGASMFLCFCIGVSLDIKSNCDSSALDDSSSLLHKIFLTNRQPGTDTIKSSDSQKENTNHELKIKNNFQSHIYSSFSNHSKGRLNAK